MDIVQKVLDSFMIQYTPNNNLASLGVTTTDLPHYDIHHMDASGAIALGLFQSIPDQKIVEIGCNREGEDIAELYVVGADQLDPTKIRYQTPGVQYKQKCGMVIARGYDPPPEFYFKDTFDPKWKIIRTITSEDKFCNAAHMAYIILSNPKDPKMEYDEGIEWHDGKVGMYELGPWEQPAGMFYRVEFPKNGDGTPMADCSLTDSLVATNDDDIFGDKYQLRGIGNVLCYGVPVQKLIYFADPSADTGNGKYKPIFPSAGGEVYASIISKEFNNDQPIANWYDDATWGDTAYYAFHGLTEGQDYRLDPYDKNRIRLFGKQHNEQDPPNWDFPQYYNERERDINPTPYKDIRLIGYWRESELVKTGSTGVVPAASNKLPRSICAYPDSDYPEYSIYINYNYSHHCIQVYDPNPELNNDGSLKSDAYTKAQQVVFQVTPAVINDEPATIYTTPYPENHFEGGFIDLTADIVDKDPATQQDFKNTPNSRMQDAIDGSCVDINLAWIEPVNKNSLAVSAEYVKSLLDIRDGIPITSVVLSPDADIKLGQRYGDGVVCDINYAFQDSGSYLITATIGPIWGNGAGQAASVWTRRVEQIERDAIIIQKNVQPDPVNGKIPNQYMYTVQVKDMGIYKALNGTPSDLDIGDLVKVTIRNHPTEKKY